MILTKEKGKRMWGNGFGAGSSSSGGSGGSGGGGEGGSTNYAAEAGHAREADHAASAAKLDSNSPDWNVIARKNVEETIAETWTFAKGLIASMKSYFNAGIQVIGGIIADFIGSAANRVSKIWATDLDVTNINAKNTTTENLVVTKEAHFFKLVIDELLSNKGAIIISSANCTAELVVPDNQQSPTYFDVYFSTVDRDGNSVSNPWRKDDQAICMTFNIGGAGTFENVSNRYYWRLVTAVESNVEYPAGSGATYHRVRLSNVSGEYEGSTTPDVGDDIVQLGYRGNDVDYRKSAIILSAYPTMDAAVTPPSLCFYQGVSTFALSDYRKTYMDAANNDFYGNFRVYADGSWKNITTIFASEAGLQEEVSHREAADQALANGYSQLKMSWNKISQSVFSLVNIANKSSFTQIDTTTEWASDINGDAIVANTTFASYKPKEMVVSFDYEYTTYPSQGVQSIVVFGYVNGSSTRSFEINISIASDGSVTATKTIGGNNVDFDVTVDGTTGHVNVTFRNGGNDITSANVHISPQWGVITIENIIVADTDESHSFKRTGIDVTQGVIKLIADQVNFLLNDGTTTNPYVQITSDGKLKATSGEFSGKIIAGEGQIGGFTIGTKELTNEDWQAGIDISYDSKVVKIGENAKGTIDTEDAILRAENAKTKSTSTDTYNTALYLNAQGAKYNYAFYGNGNGVLNGLIFGYKVNAFDVAGSVDATYNLDIRDGATVIFTGSRSAGTASVYVPKISDIRKALGITSNAVKFAFEYALSNQTSGNGTIKLVFRRYPDGNSQYPYRTNFDNNYTGNNYELSMATGDYAKILLIWDGSEYKAFVIRYIDGGWQ